MSKETKQLLWAFCLVCFVALLVIYTVRAQTLESIETAAPVQSVDWLARCNLLYVEETEDTKISSVAMSSDSMRTLLKVDKRSAWLQCRKIGKDAFACQGPVSARAEMAKTCTVSPWADATKLDSRARDAMRLTCCGEATVGGEVRTMWPCGWPMAQVVRIDGYGPGVVGSESPCAHVKQTEIKPVEPVKEIR